MVSLLILTALQLVVMVLSRVQMVVALILSVLSVLIHNITLVLHKYDYINIMNNRDPWGAQCRYYLKGKVNLCATKSQLY